MRQVAWVVSLLSLGIAVSLAAQELEPRFVQWEPPAASLPGSETWRADRRDTALVRRDYRYEGLAFGGIVFGAAGAWVGWNVAHSCPTVPGTRCEPDRLGNAVAVGLVGAALGGGLGYLIGRFSSKPYPTLPPAKPLSPSLVPDSTRRRAGYNHWKGAAIGAGSGALLGTLLGLVGRTGCSDCNGGPGDVLRVGLLGAGLGGALGFLAGLASPRYE